MQPNHAQRREHEDTRAGSEIASINRHRELKKNGSPESAFAGTGGFSESTHQSLAEEKHGGEEDEERDQLGKSPVVGQCQQHAPDKTSKDANGHKPHQPGPHSAQVLPVAV